MRQQCSDETNGAPAFRIPSLVNCSGTLVAAIDKASSGADWGYIEIAVRRSTDDGKTWSPIKSILVPPARETKVGDEYYKSSFYIDPCMTVAKNGDIVMLVTFFPECKGIHNKKLLDHKKAAFAQADGKMCPVLYDKNGRFYTVRENGCLYNGKNEKTDYRLKTDRQAPYYETGDLYRGDEMMGNIYLNGAMGKNEMKTVLAFGAPIKAPKRSYIFMTRSSDAGETWSAPKDITGEVLFQEDGTFLGVAPGNGIALEDGRHGFDLQAQDVAEALLNYAPFEHGFFWWGGYGVSEEHTAYLNLEHGIPAPQSGSIAQNGAILAEQIGGQIFSDVWGLVAPHDIFLAARLADKSADLADLFDRKAAVLDDDDGVALLQSLAEHIDIFAFSLCRHIRFHLLQISWIGMPHSPQAGIKNGLRTQEPGSHKIVVWT